MKFALLLSALFADTDSARSPTINDVTTRDLQCSICCDEYNSVVTCINYQVRIAGNAAIRGCANCVQGLIDSGTCSDVIGETCSGLDTCLCNSSCKLWTDRYLKCMKGVKCSSNTCSGPPGSSAGTPATTPSNPSPAATGDSQPTTTVDINENTVCNTEEECSAAVSSMGINTAISTGAFPTKGCFVKNGVG